MKTNHNNVFIKTKMVEKARNHVTQIVVIRPTIFINKYRDEKAQWKLQRECLLSGEAIVEESGFFVNDHPVNLKSYQYRDAIRNLYGKAVIDRHDKPLQPLKPLF